jgi:hypothetical protein
MGLGFFLLLNTQGRLPWSFWWDALAFWPVLLVALGLRLVFDRSKTPWAVLISPVLVLGTLSYLAVEGPPERRHEWHPVHAVSSTDVDRWALEGRLAAADLDIEGRPLAAGVLVEGEATEPDFERLGVKERDKGARVRLDRWQGHGPVILFPRRPHAFRLGVRQELPLELDFECAFVGGTLDMARIPVEDFRMEGAFNSLTLRLGGLDPDEDGEVRLRLSGAFNHLEIRVPPDTPVRMRSDGPNIVETPPGARSLEGPGYAIRVDGAFNRVVVSETILELERHVET